VSEATSTRLPPVPSDEAMFTLLGRVGRQRRLDAECLSGFAELLTHPAVVARAGSTNLQSRANAAVELIVDWIEGLPNEVDRAVATAALAPVGEFADKSISVAKEILATRGISTDVYKHRRPRLLRHLAGHLRELAEAALSQAAIPRQILDELDLITTSGYIVVTLLTRTRMITELRASIRATFDDPVALASLYHYARLLAARESILSDSGKLGWATDERTRLITCLGRVSVASGLSEYRKSVVRLCLRDSRELAAFASKLRRHADGEGILQAWTTFIDRRHPPLIADSPKKMIAELGATLDITRKYVSDPDAISDEINIVTNSLLNEERLAAMLNSSNARLFRGALHQLEEQSRGWTPKR
jgi:hypothetical protein